MKILRINTEYLFYFDDFYDRNPTLVDASYMEQKEALEKDFFSWPNAMKAPLQNQGFEYEEIVANCEPLQRAYASEQGLTFDNDWIIKIAFEQAKRFSPDILYLGDYTTFTPNWINDLKRNCPSIKLVVAWCGAPFQDKRFFSGYDLVLTCIPELKTQFESMGLRSEHLHHGFDTRVLEFLNQDSKKYDLSFVGQVVRANKYHLRREQILEYLLEKKANLTMFSPSQVQAFSALDQAKLGIKKLTYNAMKGAKALGFSQALLEKVPVFGKAAEWEESPVSPINEFLQCKMLPGKFGLQMLQTLKDSKIVLNTHIDISKNSASNMRIFEATGVGSCLLTDWKDNINELFEDGKEIVTYKTPEECFEKYLWLMDNPVEREAIAKQGQERVFADHTFTNRAERLASILNKALR